jgi:hypothetical protein
MLKIEKRIFSSSPTSGEEKEDPPLLYFVELLFFGEASKEKELHGNKDEIMSHFLFFCCDVELSFLCKRMSAI